MSVCVGCGTIRRVATSACIALLRAINVAGLNAVAMADLRELMTSLGLEGVTTLLQSGNVVFRSNKTADSLEQQLERASEKEFGSRIEFFVRTAAEWKAMIAANPFSSEARADPAHLLAVTLKSAPTAANVTALQRAIKGREVVRAKGRCAYIVYPDGVGRSKLTSALIEKTLGTRGTARNWNTVLKLAALAERL
jgi:uncharacterized protein (DUF1697 family)